MIRFGGYIAGLSIAGSLAGLTPHADAGTSAPFEAKITCKVFGPSPAECLGTYKAPANQQLTIEYVSFFCFAKGDPKFSELIMIANGAGVTENTVVITLPENPGSGSVQAGQPVKFYIDAGTNVDMQVTIHGGSFTDNCDFALTGEQTTVTSN